MKRLMNIKSAKLMAWGTSLCFLAIHIAMFIMFRQFGVRPMAAFNIFSIAFYICMLGVVQKNLLRAFVVAVYLEVVAHMSLAAYFTGWNSGFQTTLIGMNILLFFGEYVGRYIQIPYVKSMPMALVGMAAYLITCVVDHSRPARYPLPDNVVFQLQMFWGVVVFSIVLLFLVIFVHLSARSEELLSREVNHDQLTGLPNRYYVADYLGEMMDSTGLEGHWAAMVDIDDFKVINDTYGHNCGDFILRELAVLLQNSPIDMKVSRWGGEEFLLIGTCGDGREACLEALDALRRMVMDHCFDYEKMCLHVTVTMGVADYPAGATIREWINLADQRLYDGKTSGKNKVVA